VWAEFTPELGEGCAGAGVPDLERTPHLQSEYCKVKASIAKICHTSSLLGNIKYVLSLNSHSDWFQLTTISRFRSVLLRIRQSEFRWLCETGTFIKGTFNAYITRDPLCRIWNH